MCVSEALIVTGKHGRSMHGLAESGCPRCSRSGGGGGAIFRMERNWSPVAEIWVFGLGVGDSGSSFFVQYPFLNCLVQILTMNAPIA